MRSSVFIFERSGWASARDEDRLKKEDVWASFVESVADDPLFKRQKRHNERLDLRTSFNIQTSTNLSRC